MPGRDATIVVRMLLLNTMLQSMLLQGSSSSSKALVSGGKAHTSPSSCFCQEDLITLMLLPGQTHTHLPGRDATPVALKLLLNKCFQACFCREAHPSPKLLFLEEKPILIRAHATARTRSYPIAHASTRISSSSSQAHASAWINLYSVSGSIMDKIISLISCVYQNKFKVLPSTRFCEDKLRLPSSCFCQDKLILKSLQYASARTRAYYS
jgi:hypothetical protein